MALTILKVATFLGTAAADHQPTEHGFRMSTGDAQVEVAIEGKSAFRVSIAHAGGVPQQRSSRMLAQQTEHAQFDIQEDPQGTTLHTKFGSIILSNDASFKFSDSLGNVLVQSDILSTFDGTHLTAFLGKASTGSDRSTYYGAGAQAGSPLTMDHSTPTVSNH